MRRHLFAPLLAAFAAPAIAPAATLLVPQDYATVADGLNAASFGDTVLVDCGVYVVQRATLPSGVLLNMTGTVSQTNVMRMRHSPARTNAMRTHRSPARTNATRMLSVPLL